MAHNLKTIIFWLKAEVCLKLYLQGICVTGVRIIQ